MRNKIGRVFLAALLFLCITLLATVTRAEDSKTPAAAEDIWARKKLGGDLFGLRTELGKHGIGLDFRLSQYYQAVTSGGTNTNGEYGGTMDYRVNVDGHKLGLWKGLSSSMHARTRFGQDVNADAGPLVIQNTGLMMPAPADYHDTDVTGLTVSQFLPFPIFGQPALVTLGLFDVVDTVTGFFPSLAYGQEGFWNINSTITSLPWFGAVRGLSLYGGIGVTINKEYKVPQSGFIVLGTENESTRWGSVDDAFEEGAWLAGFHKFFWKLDGKPGYLMIFGGYSTADQKSNDPHDFFIIPGQGIANTTEKNPWDIAAYVSQVFWQAEGNPNRKATILIGGTVGPDDPQFAQWHIFANVEAYGPMASRPNDRMGVGGWYNGLSDNYKDLVSPVVQLRDLWGVEFYYNAEIIPSVHLSPNVQLVRNEREDDDFAVILGARLVMDF